MPTPPIAALRRLREGNDRFRLESPADGQSPEAATGFADLTSGQEPFAAVLGCSDSRVPVETVFDQGPGQLFVVRVAGNIVAPTQLGSLEFAVEGLGVRLIVVLGHTGCGAVAATLTMTPSSEAKVTANLGAITARISKAVGSSSYRESPPNDADMDEAMRLNVAASCNELVRQSEVLASVVRSGEILIVGAVFNLKTGQVEFSDEACGIDVVHPGGRRGAV